MALTRSFLKGMSLTDEQVSAIVEEHANSIEGLKKDRDKFKADAEKLPAVQKELDELKASGGDWEKKYNDEHSAFEKYKSEVTAKEKTSSLKSAYKKLLTEAKVGDSHIDAVLKVTDFSKMELDKEGKLVDADKLSENIKTEWAGFISSKETKGTNVETPPANGGKATSREEIMKIKDTTERQKAIAENHELFGF